MKSEERHELKENDLASWLQFGIWTFLRQNGSYVLLVLALGFLGFQLWRLYEQKQENHRQMGFSEYHALPTLEENIQAYFTTDRPGKLLGIIDTYDIKTLQAECYTDLGTYYDRIITLPPLLAAQKLSRDEALDKAKDALTKAIDRAGQDTFLAGKAHLGLAAVYEDQGQWDKARAEYEMMTSKSGMFAGSPFAQFAGTRLATLDQRMNAPRLASMIPPPAPANPLPSSLNPLQNNSFPGVFNQGIGPMGPSLPVTTSPAITPFSPLGPSIMPPPPGPTSAPGGAAPAVETAPATGPR